MTFGPLLALWRWSDERMRRLSRSLQRMLRLIRLALALLVLGILVVAASAVVGLLWPQWFPYAYAAAVLFLLLPLAVFAFIVSVPLRWKSLVRLIDKGYPASGRELGIRAMAQKWRDESIATEELLVEAAWNEAKKVYRKATSSGPAAPVAPAGGPDRPPSPPAALHRPDGPGPGHDASRHGHDSPAGAPPDRTPPGAP